MYLLRRCSIPWATPPVPFAGPQFGLASCCDSSMFTPCIAGITDVYHHASLFFVVWANLKPQPSYLYLPHSWEYSCEPPQPWTPKFLWV
jgi:hypothetical protein